MKIDILVSGFNSSTTYKKVCFTGHRPPKLGGYDRNNSTRVTIKKALKEFCSRLVLNQGTEEFMEGMAQGIDQDAGDVILSIIKQIKSEGNGESYVKLHAAIPYPGQEKVWPTQAQDYYDSQLDSISDLNFEDELVHYLHDHAPKHTWEAVKWLDDRNHYMVDWADLVIGVWDGTPGGTKNCIDYAKSVGKPIVLLKLSQ